MSRRLRLLKVVVQPVFVVDDEEHGLAELRADPVEVSAAEWPGFATGRFVEAMEALRAEVEADPRP